MALARGVATLENEGGVAIVGGAWVEGSTNAGGGGESGERYDGSGRASFVDGVGPTVEMASTDDVMGCADGVMASRWSAGEACETNGIAPSMTSNRICRPALWGISVVS